DRLGRRERDSCGDEPDGGAGRARRFRGRPRAAHAPAAAASGELRRVEPDSGQERDGDDGAARGGVSPADGAAASPVEAEDRGSAPAARHQQGSPCVTIADLPGTIDRLASAGTRASRDEARQAFAALRGALTEGTARAAEPDPSSASGWKVNAWVKRGILLGFRFGDTIDMSADHGRWPFFDKDTLPLKQVGAWSAVRIVPGGSTIRDGAYLGRGVICMPPMYINIGAHVGDETLVDSHALVGSCAQIGSRVHLSAAA